MENENFNLIESINMKYKPKVSALKQKLKEKLEVIDKMAIDFERWKEEHETRTQQVVNRSNGVVAEKNALIRELLSKIERVAAV